MRCWMPWRSGLFTALFPLDGIPMSETRRWSPIKGILWTALTYFPERWRRGTMAKRIMHISHIVKEMYLFFAEKQTSGNGMHRRISPSLVKESASLIKMLKELFVFVRAEKGKRSNFKIGPKVAVIVLAFWGDNKTQIILFLVDQFSIFSHKWSHRFPERRNRFSHFSQSNRETVFFSCLFKKHKRIVINVASELHTRLNSPIILVFQWQWMFVKESRIKSAHEAIRFQSPIDNLRCLIFLPHLSRPSLVNPDGIAPMTLGNQSKFHCARHYFPHFCLEFFRKAFIIDN